MATRPTITPVPTFPNRQSGSATFAMDADAALIALPQMVGEINVVVTYVDGRAAAAEQFATSAGQAASSASGHANAADQAKQDAQTAASEAAADRQAVEAAIVDGPVIMVNGRAGIVEGIAEADLSNVPMEVIREAADIGSNGEGNRTVSTQAPSGTASEGDIWYRIEQ